MSALPVARMEFRRHLRGKTPWLVGAFLVLLSRLPTPPSPAVQRELGRTAPLANAQVVLAMVIPLAAAALGYYAIIGERESGTIRILAGTAVSRAELVVGKVLGYSGALAVPVISGTLLVVGFDASRYGAVSIPSLVGLLVVALIYVLGCVTIVISLSTIVSSTTRAAVAVFGFATLGTIFWSDVTTPFLWQLIGGSPPGNTMQHVHRFEFLQWLSVTSSYYAITNWLFGAPVGPMSATLQVEELLNQQSVSGSARPAYLAPWVSFLPLIGWPIGSLLLGIATISRGDLALSNRRDLWEHLPQRLHVSVGLLARLDNWSETLDALPGAWQPLARREFHRFTRSTGVWLVGALVFVAAALSLSPRPVVRDALGSVVPLAALQNPIRLFGGAGILFGTFRSVISERDSGSIRVTAGTAASRTDILVGILVGRVTAYVIPVSLAVIFVCLLAVPQYGLVPFGALLGFIALTVVYLIAIAGLGVGISVLSRSQPVAGGLVLGVVILSFIWDTILNALYGAATGMQVSGFEPPADPLYLLLEWLPPISLFNVATNPLLGVPNSSGPASWVIIDLQPLVVTNTIVVRTVLGMDIPVWYLHPAMGLVGLLLWFAVPFGAALMQFRRGDLG